MKKAQTLHQSNSHLLNDKLTLFKDETRDINQYTNYLR